ncbi:MAG: Asp-tRNA(Asn)/Glu-tRNA(Gln) amidotransferase subunit GatC [Acidimicrobiales bacterium]
MTGGQPDRSQPDRSQPAISAAEVDRVARLAHLDLAADQVARFAGQLGGVLDYARTLAALDTSGVEPTSHPSGLVNVLRADVVRPGLDPAEVLSQAPEAESGRFRVPAVLGSGPAETTGGAARGEPG